MASSVAFQPDTHRATTVASHHQSVQRAIEVMRERLDEPLTLQTMAEAAFMSPYHFNRVFCKITGVPPCRFLYALRQEAAKQLLLATPPRKVIEICYEVGYNSVGTFTKRFSELLGLSPTRFRSIVHASGDGLLRRFSHATRPTMMHHPPGSGLVGRVDAPDDFRGLIFIGLFPTQIPEGRPVACAVKRGPGPYHLARVPDGRFYLLTVGLAWSKDPKTYFLYEEALRGGGQSIRVRHGTVQGVTHLSLRPPEPFDPPILMVLPHMLTKGLREPEIAVA